MKFLYYYFKMLRIDGWIKLFFWIPIVGAGLVQFSFRNFILVGIIYFCVTSYSYVINNYFDLEIDKRNDKKIKLNTNPLAQGLITKKGILILLGILLLFPVILAFQMNFVGFIFVLLSLFSSTLYSVRYIRLKERTGIDIVTHGLMFGLFPFLAGVTLAGGVINFPLVLIGILFGILGCGVLLFHQINDYENDLGNTQTTVIKIGKRNSYIALFLAFIAYLLCFEIAVNYFILLEWWLHYSLLGLLIFWWVPFYWILEAKNKIIKHSFSFSKIIRSYL